MKKTERFKVLQLHDLFVKCRNFAVYKALLWDIVVWNDCVSSSAVDSASVNKDHLTSLFLPLILDCLGRCSQSVCWGNNGGLRGKNYRRTQDLHNLQEPGVDVAHFYYYNLAANEWINDTLSGGAVLSANSSAAHHKRVEGNSCGCGLTGDASRSAAKKILHVRELLKVVHWEHFQTTFPKHFAEPLQHQAARRCNWLSNFFFF